IDYLSSNAWRHLASDGGVYLRVSTTTNPRGILAGNFSLSGSERCLLRQLQRDNIVSEDHEANQGPRITVCEYDAMKYNDGDSWHATRHECTMCSCQVQKDQSNILVLLKNIIIYDFLEKMCLYQKKKNDFKKITNTTKLNTTNTTR